ncbi:hypothetical protein [Erythrobacter sp. JK5]|uniref:hypothetical protein n=1 Tax=Erythrobacter sp. JK5 TaxID=2829500 RepID=UPI001BADCA72|nr:hypothetical protein [Erythrobacter sp. JK5]QUL37027.1 hypothetical protein KDC96_11560 [Erythrobacter sp. JK5]
MEPPIWIGIAGTVVVLAFLINGMRLARGEPGHAANAGRLHAAVSIIVLPLMWLVIAGMTR